MADLVMFTSSLSFFYILVLLASNACRGTVLKFTHVITIFNTVVSPQALRTGTADLMSTSNAQQSLAINKLPVTIGWEVLPR